MSWDLIRDLFTDVLLILGTAFMVIAGLGIVRMPDLFTRMQAAAKTGTLGVGLVIAAVAVHYGQMGIVTQAIIVIAFFFLTTPVAAHMIARAAYFTGVPLWEKSVVDELRGRYNPLPPEQDLPARDD